MGLQVNTINTVLFALLVTSVCGLVAMYQNHSQQHQQIAVLQAQLIEKENQIVVSNEALSYRRYQHQLLVEDYNRYREGDSLNSMLQ